MTPPASDSASGVALELLTLLKEELGSEADGVSDEHLLKFLRWKPSVKRAAERFRLLVKWMKENPWAFAKPLSEDEELQKLLEGQVLVAPKEMTDQEGRQVMVGRLRFNDMTDGRTPKDVARMLLFTIDQVLQEQSVQENGIIIFHDLTGLTTKNVDPGIPKLLLSAIIGHFPLRIHGIYVYNAPWFFKTMFSVVSMLMPSKLRQRTHFINDFSKLPIGKDELLVEHGGKRVHDQKDWIKSKLHAEKDGTFTSLKECQTA